jgi:sialic acid synthase SpsE
VHLSLGTTVRNLSAAQMEKRKVFRRRLVVTHSLAKGERIAAEDVEFKRPGTGISPDELSYVLGRVMARNVAAEEELSWSDFA